jgi:hypothetical protein
MSLETRLLLLSLVVWFNLTFLPRRAPKPRLDAV